MTALNKKRKCRNTLYDRGGEKDKKTVRWKRYAMFHKHNRVANNKITEYEE